MVVNIVTRPVEPVESEPMPETTPTDQIYRAAIEAASHLDDTTGPDLAGVSRLLIAALERRLLDVECVVGGSDGGGVNAGRSLLTVSDTDGIVVTIAGDDHVHDPGTLLLKQHWQRAHVMTFAPRALSIKTISA